MCFLSTLPTLQARSTRLGAQGSEHKDFKATHVPRRIAAAVLRRSRWGRDVGRGACVAIHQRRLLPSCASTAAAAVPRRRCRRQRRRESARASTATAAAVPRHWCGHHHGCAWRRLCGTSPVHMPHVHARASANARAVCWCTSEHARGQHVVARQAHPPQIWCVWCVHRQDLRL